MFEGCPPERSGRPRSHRLEGVGNGVHRWMITGPHGVTEPGLQGWLVPFQPRTCGGLMGSVLQQSFWR